MMGTEFLNLIVLDLIWSGVAAVGFAILFNVPKRFLIGCFICGAVGHSLRTILTNSGVSIEFSTLFGATAVGFISVYLSRRYSVPMLVFTVTGAIPLVPGVFAFQTITNLINATSAQGSEGVDFLVTAGINGIRTSIILGAIAFGIAAPMLLFRRNSPAI